MGSRRNTKSYGLGLKISRCLAILAIKCTLTTVPYPNVCTGFALHPAALQTNRGTSPPPPLPTLSMSPPLDNGDFFDEISKPNDPQRQPQPPLPPSQQRTDDTTAPPPTDPGDFEAHIPKINSVTLVGRIGQSPEPRYFDDGKVVLRLSLAVKRKYHPLERRVRNIKSGEEETDWFNLEMWGKDAEYAGKYVTKGARVGITGTLNIDAWVDKMTGDEKSSAKIIVKQFDILESRAEAELRMGGRGSTMNSGGGTNNYYKNQREEDQEGDGPSSAGSGDFFA